VPPALQPDLHPWSVWQRRGLVLAALILALALLAWLGHAQQRPPRVLAGNHAPDYLHTVEDLIDQAEERAWLMVYVLYGGDTADHPVNHLVRRLAAARRRGVDVRVVLDIGTEWGSDELDPKHEQALALLASHDVPTITDELDRTSHAKVLLVDDHHAVLGSHNWTRSALLRNREAAIWISDPHTVSELESLFTTVPGFADMGGSGAGDR